MALRRDKKLSVSDFSVVETVSVCFTKLNFGILNIFLVEVSEDKADSEVFKWNFAKSFNSVNVSDFSAEFESYLSVSEPHMQRDMKLDHGERASLTYLPFCVVVVFVIGRTDCTNVAFFVVPPVAASAVLVRI